MCEFIQSYIQLCRSEIWAVGRKHFAVNKIFISQSRGVPKFLVEGLDFMRLSH